MEKYEFDHMCLLNEEIHNLKNRESDCRKDLHVERKRFADYKNIIKKVSH